MTRVLVTAVLATVAAFAQNLTPEQKEADFRYLASQFVTYYAPLDWKKQFLRVDGLDIKAWLEARQANEDRPRILRRLRRVCGVVPGHALVVRASVKFCRAPWNRRGPVR